MQVSTLASFVNALVKDEGLHNGDYWRPNGRFGVKVPANTDGIGGAQNPMRQTPQHDAGKSFSSIVCNLNCTYSISPFWRWTPSKQYWSALFPLFTKYGSHLDPREESTEQMISCSPNRIIKIQYLLPFKTMIKVPRPSESIWSGLMAPLLPIRDHSIWVLCQEHWTLFHIEWEPVIELLREMQHCQTEGGYRGSCGMQAERWC